MPEQVMPVPNEAGWSRSPLADVCELIRRGTAPSYVDESDVYAIGQRCVAESGFDPTFARPHEKRRMSGTLVPRPGDVLLNSTGTGTIGRSCTFDDDGRFIVDGHVTVLRPKPSVADGRWIETLFRSPWGQTYLEARCFSGSTNQVELSRSQLAATAIPLPAIAEQRRIGNVLGIVDEAIRSSERLIAKLDLMKHGLAHDLLSLGLGENGGLRDRVQDPRSFHMLDGLKFPKGWAKCDLDNVVDSHRPVVYGILMPGYGFAGGVPVVKVKDMKDGQIDEEELLLTDPRTDNEYRRSRVKAGDLLFSIRGTVGRAAFVPATLEGANITQDTARIAVKGANPRFIAQYLRTPLAVTFIELHTIGQAVRGINLRDVRRIPIILPPKSEQDALADILDTHDRQIRTERQRCAKLRLLKSGLMEDLLTGHVRVDEDAA
jgi:type I restriction enzyme S subunit